MRKQTQNAQKLQARSGFCLVQKQSFGACNEAIPIYFYIFAVKLSCLCFRVLPTQLSEAWLLGMFLWANYPEQAAEKNVKAALHINRIAQKTNHWIDEQRHATFEVIVETLRTYTAFGTMLSRQRNVKSITLTTDENNYFNYQMRKIRCFAHKR